MKKSLRKLYRDFKLGAPNRNLLIAFNNEDPKLLLSLIDYSFMEDIEINDFILKTNLKKAKFRKTKKLKTMTTEEKQKISRLLDSQQTLNIFLKFYENAKTDEERDEIIEIFENKFLEESFDLTNENKDFINEYFALTNPYTSLKEKTEE